MGKMSQKVATSYILSFSLFLWRGKCFCLTQYSILTAGLYVWKNLELVLIKEPEEVEKIQSLPEKTANIWKGLPSFLARKSNGNAQEQFTDCMWRKKRREAETNNAANISLGLCSVEVNYSKVHRWHLVCGLQPSDLLLKGDLVVWLVGSPWVGCYWTDHYCFSTALLLYLLGTAKWCGMYHRDHCSEESVVKEWEGVNHKIFTEYLPF